MNWSYKEVLNPKKPEKVLSQSADCKQYLGYSTHKVRVHETVKFGLTDTDYTDTINLDITSPGNPAQRPTNL